MTFFRNLTKPNLRLLCITVIVIAYQTTCYVDKNTQFIVVVPLQFIRLMYVSWSYETGVYYHEFIDRIVTKKSCDRLLALTRFNILANELGKIT